MKRLKYFFAFLLLALVFALPLTTFALEVIYPELPGSGSSGFPSLNTLPEVSISQYIQYVFIFSYTIAGFIGVIIIVVAGFQILLFAGNPSKITEARERIFNAILGIAILMISVTLLLTINPSLINLRVNASPVQAGLYLRGQVTPSDQYPFGYVYVPITSRQVANVTPFLTSAFPPGLTVSNPELFYNCSGVNSNIPNILVWVYDDVSFFINPASNGTSNVNTISLRCGGLAAPIPLNSGLPILSFSWEYERPGIYFYMLDNCQGISSRSQTESGFIPYFNDFQRDTLNQGIYSIKAINGLEQDFNYGFILTESESGAGECSLPVFPTRSDGCVSSSSNEWPLTIGDEYFDVPEQFDPSYIYILKQDTNLIDSRNESSGITFESPNYFLSISQNNIGDMWTDNHLDCEATNTCNLDTFIRNSGRIKENLSSNEILEGECCTESLDGLDCQTEGPDYTLDPLRFRYNPEDQSKTYMRFIDTGGYVPNSHYKGYKSCIDNIRANSLYYTIFYSKNYLEDDPDFSRKVFDRSCIILKGDKRFDKQDSNTIRLFGNQKEIYRTVVVPAEE